jgi:hypothetical protein
VEAALPEASSAPVGGPLPELAAVPWRPRASDGSLERRNRLWTLTTVAHVVPFVITAIGLVLLQPLALPVSLIALAKAWIIPELYAQRGANVVRPRLRLGEPPGTHRPTPAAERRALGLLGDLVGHDARELHARTGLVLERGRLGVWLVGEAGALLVRPGGRRVLCWCVRAADPHLPAGDRIAHLLLALREDEAGFATVANLAFSGARWRVRRRMDRVQRPALDAATVVAREPVAAPLALAA